MINTRKKRTLRSRLSKPHLLPRLLNRIRSFFYVDQWTLLVGSGISHKSPSWVDFKSILPPLDRDWADPFVWISDGRRFVFFEEKPYSTNRGHISCLTLDEQMNIVSNQIVLQRPYHLSYPFLFEYGGQLYMIPETQENHAIELYKCTHFPDQWEFVKTLIARVDAVDATLLQTNSKWWMFANIVQPDGNSWNTLYLYFADNPLSDQWTPHPRNPIVKEITSARPAGRVFLHNESPIRPSQDCSVRYGYAINFNRITSLTDVDYAESRELTFRPPSNGNVLATHTWNEAGSLNIIDAKMRRPRFW